MAYSNKRNLTNISDQEILFLQGSLTDFRVEGNYCYGFVKANFEEVIEQFLALSSTCFVTKEAHFKQKGHKRFSETSKFAICLVMNKIMIYLNHYDVVIFILTVIYTRVENVNANPLPLEIILPPRQNNIFLSGMSGRNSISEVLNRGLYGHKTQ